MILVNTEKNLLEESIFISFPGQHIVRAISLLPEYFWFVEVHLVSPHPLYPVE